MTPRPVGRIRFKMAVEKLVDYAIGGSDSPQALSQLAKLQQN